MESSPRKRCFVLSPIGEEGTPVRTAADKVLRHVIKKALGDTYTVERADDNVNPGSITPSIVASILEADLIVADLTGYNANVFYELAIAHGYGKPTVHLQKKGERPPFDVKDMRIVSYDMYPDELETAQARLRESASFAISKPEKVETPLSSASRFAAVHESTDPVAESNVRVMDAIENLTREVQKGMAPQTAAAGFTRTGRPIANARSAQKIIESIVMNGRARLEDFNGAITGRTDNDYDGWVKGMVAVILGSDLTERVPSLYHSSVLRGEDEVEFS